MSAERGDALDSDALAHQKADSISPLAHRSTNSLTLEQQLVRQTRLSEVPVTAGRSHLACNQAEIQAHPQ